MNGIHQSIEAAFNITANGSTDVGVFHGAAALDCVCHFNSGSGSVQFEISIDGLSKWVPVGPACTVSGLSRYQVPEGIYFRFTTTLASALDVDISVFDE